MRRNGLARMLSLALSICTVAACSQSGDTAARDSTNGISGDMAAAIVPVSARATDRYGGTSNADNAVIEQASVNSAPSAPTPTTGRQLERLPLPEGWYTGRPRCSKEDEIEDYMRLYEGGRRWSIHGPGEIVIEKIIQTGPGRYRTIEMMGDELGVKQRFTVDYEQLSPTTFRKSWAEPYTLTLCPPEQTPPTDESFDE